MDLLALYAANHPDKAAVIYDRPGHPGVTWSYPEIDAESAGLRPQTRDPIPKVRAVLIFECGGDLAQQLGKCPAPARVRAPTSDISSATMIYTSGTTGKPKGALRTRTMDSSAAAG